MEAMIHGFLIDPKRRTIKSVKFEDTPTDIYRLIDADCFDIARTDPTTIIFVDDNGLYTKNLFGFLHKGYHSPLCGKALVCGTNGGGETVDATTTMKYLMENVQFFVNDSSDAVYKES